MEPTPDELSAVSQLIESWGPALRGLLAVRAPWAPASQETDVHSFLVLGPDWAVPLAGAPRTTVL
eukprot:15446504-Alexandrium_andersonii.AAC.1